MRVIIDKVLSIDFTRVRTPEIQEIIGGKIVQLYYLWN